MQIKTRVERKSNRAL